MQKSVHVIPFLINNGQKWGPHRVYAWRKIKGREEQREAIWNKRRHWNVGNWVKADTAVSRGHGSALRPEVGGQEVSQAGPNPGLTAPLPTVADLLYWKDTKTSGVVFTGLMVSLLCLLHFSIVSVAAHVALMLLCGTISLRVYRKVLQAVHRGDGANPFQ